MDKLLSILKPQEMLNLKLRYLYENNGYKEYKMSSFEEYKFYLENSSYLFRNAVITFTDLDGRLLALKPDVTPSIVKRADGSDLKVYYNENVYRPDRNKRSFKEISQIGLEHMGKLDTNNVAEVVSLAAQSLKLISEQSLLELGHCGFVEGALDICGVDAGTKNELRKLIAHKNAPGIKKLCADNDINDNISNILAKIPALCGEINNILRIAKELCMNDAMLCAVEELENICGQIVSNCNICNIRIDLSLIGEEGYYNNITFCGYVRGAYARVLSGGRYDPLLKKLGKNFGAIGFALYFDELEPLFYEDRGEI